MHWVIKVSYRKRNAAGEKRFFGIRVLGVMAAVCVSLAAAGMRAEPVSAAAGTQMVLEAAADTAQEAGYGDYDYSAIDRAVRQNSGYSISFQEIINQITGEDGVTGQRIFPVLNKTFLVMDYAHFFQGGKLLAVYYQSFLQVQIEKYFFPF